MKIIYDNVADTATLSASTTAGSLVVGNLKTDLKSEVWRSTSTTATITAIYTTPQLISGVILPFCNLTSTALFRLKLYTNVADTSPVLDTGDVYACANVTLGSWLWGSTPLGVNAYSYGGAAYGRVWCTPTACKKFELIITDTANTSGYIEAGRLVAGSYFSPQNDAEMGLDWDNEDRTKNERTDAGELRSDIGTQNACIKFSLENMTPSDRAQVMNIMKNCAKFRPIFVSLFPDDADPTKEQQYQIYGKFKDTLAIGHSNWNLFSSSITIEEM